MAKSKSSLESQGPTQSGMGGYDPTATPPNPSDEIFAGRPLPTLRGDTGTMRLPFNMPTRNPLHYLSGPGTDESVTSRSPATPPNVGLQGEAMSEMDHTDYYKTSFGQRPAPSPDPAKTTNGVDIYGT